MADKRDNWNQDDLELDQEFEDVGNQWQRSSGKTPRVPGFLDRRIREQSRYRVGEQLQQNWILGHGPQLILAILLLFAIGVFFVISLETEDTGEGERPDAVEQRK